MKMAGKDVSEKTYFIQSLPGRCIHKNNYISNEAQQSL